jgi:hypothetical protein
VKNHLAVLLDQFVDNMEQLAAEMMEFASPNGMTDVSSTMDDETFLFSLFASSEFTFKQVMKNILTVKEFTKQIKFKIATGDIPLEEHSRRVYRLDRNLFIIRACVKAAEPYNSSVKADYDHYNEVKKVALGYKSLVNDFNELVKKYNTFNPKYELTQFASTDVGV